MFCKKGISEAFNMYFTPSQHVSAESEEIRVLFKDYLMERR